MKDWKKALLVVLVAIYVLAPDLLPGPVDDLLVLLLTAPFLRDSSAEQK